MVRFYTLILLCFFTVISQAGLAQNKSIIKTVNIEGEGEDVSVTIVTSVNGKTTKKVLTGEDAQAYIDGEDHASTAVATSGSGPAAVTSSSTNSSSSMVSIHINEDDFKTMQKELEEMGDQISLEVDRIVQEVEGMNVDSILEAVGVQIQQSVNGLQYQFTCNDGENKSVMVMSSKDEGGVDESLKVEVSVETDRNEVNKQVTVQKRTMLIEDNAERKSKAVKLNDLRFFPNPSSGTLNVQFENPKDESVHMLIKDMRGHTHHRSTVNGAGEKMLSIDVSDLSAGTYLLELNQGDRTTHKKLVLQ